MTPRCWSCSTAPGRGSPRPWRSTWTRSTGPCGSRRVNRPEPAGARQGQQGTDRAGGLVRPGARSPRTWSGPAPPWPAAASGTPALFLNARGGRLSRQSAWSMLQDRRRPRRDQHRRVAAHPAALVRHPPARRRRRRPRGPGTPRPRVGDDDADLHPGHRGSPARGLSEVPPPRVLRLRTGGYKSVGCSIGVSGSWLVSERKPWHEHLRADGGTCRRSSAGGARTRRSRAE